MKDEAVICRCEEITRTEILDAIKAGCKTIGAIKRYTRAGMGACQGRTCNRVVMQMLVEAGVEIEPTIVDKIRFPVVPCSLDSLAEDT